MKKNNDFLNKILDLKNNIENEINNIDILYEKTFNEINIFFQKKKEKLSLEKLKNDNNYQIKYESLLKEENDIKDKLQNEVTKAKEKLENNLSLINNEIRISEKINKGINKLKNDKNKDTYKILTYISEINKNQKNISKLLKTHMKSLKFLFKEDQNKIIYEEYYFNGISIPQNLEFKNISYNSLNFSWKINKIKNININEEKLNYIVEMRKNNEPFIKVYEGQNLNCDINNLDFNTYYEFKVCSIYNDIIGDW